jgi:hypothetical protein
MCVLFLENLGHALLVFDCLFLNFNDNEVRAGVVVLLLRC